MDWGSGLLMDWWVYYITEFNRILGILYNIIQQNTVQNFENICSIIEAKSIQVKNGIPNHSFHVYGLKLQSTFSE